MPTTFLETVVKGQRAEKEQHWCEGCGRPASFGEGFDHRAGKIGRSWCAYDPQTRRMYCRVQEAKSSMETAA